MEEGQIDWRGELTEARVRIRAITTPVPQLRLGARAQERERSELGALMKRSNHLSPFIYPCAPGRYSFICTAPIRLLRSTRGSAPRRTRCEACRPVFVDPNPPGRPPIICNAGSLSPR